MFSNIHYVLDYNYSSLAELFQEYSMNTLHVNGKSEDANYLMDNKIGFNDEFALGFMNRMIRMGYRIPEDLSIMGIDGVSKRRYTTPLLTSVGLNIKEQAYTGVDVLISVIEGERVNSITSVKPYLVAGQSVKRI